MADAEAPDNEQGTPEQPTSDPQPNEAPATESSQDSSFDPDQYVEKTRYENLRAEWNRAQPAIHLVEALQNPDTQEQAFQQIADELGYSVEELEELEEELNSDDEDRPVHDPRVDELIAEREAEQQEAYLDELEGWVDGEIDKLAKAAGIEDLTDDEKDVVFAALAPGDDGNPDVEAAFKKVTGLGDLAIKRYTAGKRKAPQVPKGSSASHQPNLDDARERRQWIADQLNAQG